MQRLLDIVAALTARGEWAAAEHAVTQLRQSAPDSPQVMCLGSQVLLQVGRYREARALALHLAELPLRQPELLQAVRLLRRFEEPWAIRRLVGCTPCYATLQLPDLAELALHLCSIGEYSSARECIDRMLGIAPLYGNAHYLLGLLEMFAGNKEVSLESLKRALAIEPRMASAHWLLAMQDDRSNAEAHAQMMRQVLPGIRPGSEAQAYIFYSLHHRLDSVGRYADAWQSLEQGMAVMRRLNPYYREEHHALFQSLKGIRLPRFELEPPAAGAPKLIFIVGMFRSGTSLIERVLTGHPDVLDGGETYQFSAAMRNATDWNSLDVVDSEIASRSAAADFKSVRQRMHDYALWRGNGKKWLTEKLPSNFLNLGFILHALPEAKVVHLLRDPIDTCFSNLRTIFRGAAPYASDQDDLSDYYRNYIDMMAHWHSLAPGRILDVHYRDFIEHPEKEAKRLLGNFGLDYRATVLDLGRAGGRTATASAAQVRQGILTNRDQAWRPYEAELQPLIRGLAAGRDHGQPCLK